MRAELQGPDMNGKVHQAKQESAHRMAAGARSVDRSDFSGAQAGGAALSAALPSAASLLKDRVWEPEGSPQG